MKDANDFPDPEDVNCEDIFAYDEITFDVFVEHLRCYFN